MMNLFNRRRTLFAAGVLLAAAGAFAGDSFGPKNPPPANKLQGYAGYELKPTTLAVEESNKKNVSRVLAQVEEEMRATLTPILTTWNGAAAADGNPEKLVIEPYIASIHKPSGANRFWAGAFSGNGHIVMKVKISELSTGKVIAEPEFYRRANAMAGAWTLGAHDNAMLRKISFLVGDYLRANYTEAVGGETGYEP